MLVLSRKQGESVFLNDSIVVKVLKIHGERVVIGVDAPAEIPVHRKEVYERISKEELLVSAARKDEGAAQ